MTATIDIPPSIELAILEAATARAAERILSESLMTGEEACHFLRVSTSTLNRLPVPRVKLVGSTRYRRCDLLAYIAANLER